MSSNLRRRDLLAAGPLALTGCRTSRGEYFGNTALPSARRIVFEAGSEPGSLDPAQCAMDAETDLLPALFEGLTSLHPVTAEPIAGLATHYQASGDFAKFTFYLRGHAAPGGIRLPNTGDLPGEYRRGRTAPGDHIAALWSDGRKITAEDFVYAWRRVKDPATGANLAPLYFSGIRDVRAPDEFTFQVDLTEPNPVFPKLVWMPAFAAVPRHAVEEAKTAGREASWAEPGRMISGGAFVLQEWSPRNRIVLRRNPRYYEAGAVATDELVFLPTVDGATRMNLYKTGETQVTGARAVPPVFMGLVSGARDARSSVGCRTICCGFNTTTPPFDNVLVRYALSMAVDRAAIARALGSGRIPARGLVPPLPGYVPEKNPNVSVDGHTFDICSFDPAAARALFAKAGHRGRMRISLALNEDPAKRQLGEIVQQQWRAALDADVAINAQETNFYWTQTCTKKDYQGVAVDSWSGATTDPYDFLRFSQHSCAAWVDNNYGTMLSTANWTLDPAERLRKLAEAEVHLMRRMPLLPFYHDSWLSMQKPYVRGLPLNLLGFPIFKYAWIDTNWRPS